VTGELLALGASHKTASLELRERIALPTGRAARVLAERPGSALELTKRLLYGQDGLSFEEAIARGAEVNVIARSTEECREGVRRFLESRRQR
jgi:enoyl-CoA hydratase/carnithine racemase